jgi:hypothetical protein
MENQARKDKLQVRKTPSWPRSWANFSPLSLCSHRNGRANLHILGQPNTFLAAGAEAGGARAEACREAENARGEAPAAGGEAGGGAGGRGGGGESLNRTLTVLP